MGMLGGLGLMAVGICAAALLAALLLPGALLRRATAERRGGTLLVVQITLVVALLAAVGTAVLAAAIDGAHPDWLGIPIGVGPGVAVSVGLAIVAATPAIRSRPAALRSAGLEPRSAWTIGARRHYLVPALTAAALAVVLLVTGATASRDDQGLLRAFSVVRPDGGSTASPYPGWYYAVPLLAATALLLLTTVLALRRIARLPAVGADASADRTWRLAVSSTISRLATAGLLGHLAGTLLITGSAVHSAGFGSPLELPGLAIVLVGLLAGVLACVVFGLALAAAASFRGAAAEPAPLLR